MKYEQFENLENIRDSMELPSGLVICKLTKDDKVVTIETQGDKRVRYQDEWYKSIYKMPKELIERFHNGTAYDTDDIDVVFNNWFELFYGGDKYNDPESEVVDVKGFTPDQLLKLCLEYLE